MTLLQEFKSVMTLGTKANWSFNGTEGGVREIVAVKSRGVGFSADGGVHISWLDWPKARELSKEDDKFIIEDEEFGVRLAYWLAS